MVNTGGRQLVCVRGLCVLVLRKAKRIMTWTSWYASKVHGSRPTGVGEPQMYTPSFICCKHNRLIFNTSSRLPEFVCCDHRRLIFVTSSRFPVLQTQPPDFCQEFLTSWLPDQFVYCKNNRLIFVTSSSLPEFVCCKHNRLNFVMSSWLLEFVCCNFLLWVKPWKIKKHILYHRRSLVIQKIEIKEIDENVRGRGGSIQK